MKNGPQEERVIRAMPAMNIALKSDVRQWNNKHMEPGRAYLPPSFQARTNLTSMVGKCLQST